MIPPLLVPGLDPELWRAFEDAAAAESPGEGRDDRRRGARADERPRENPGQPERPPAPGAPLRDREAERRRQAQQVDQDRHPDRSEEWVVLSLGQQQKGIARELQQHQRRGQVGEQVHRRLELVGRRPAAAEDRGKELDRGLEAAGRPARLLAAVGVHRDR